MGLGRFSGDLGKRVRYAVVSEKSSWNFGTGRLWPTPIQFGGNKDRDFFLVGVWWFCFDLECSLDRDLCRSVPPRGYSRMGFGRLTGPFGMGPYCCVLFWVVGSPLLSLSATMSRPLVRDFFQFLQLMADLACDSRDILLLF